MVRRLARLAMMMFVALVVCLGLGFAWGASGRNEMRGALDEAQLKLDLAEARGQVLDARLSLYGNNFGDASRHFEEAKEPLRRLRIRYQEASKSDATAGIDAAIARVEEAQKLAGKLDSSANAKAAEALDALKIAAGK